MRFVIKPEHPQSSLAFLERGNQMKNSHLPKGNYNICIQLSACFIVSGSDSQFASQTFGSEILPRPSHVS